MNSLIQSTPNANPEVQREATDAPSTEQIEVKDWLKRIKQAKDKWMNSFDEMRDNMEFTAGYQWPNQVKLHDDRYISNLTLRIVNQKVATLYAKNPRFVVERRPRMNYEIWDGRDLSEVHDALQLIQSPMGQGNPAAMMAALALIQDVEQGRLREKIEDRIAETLQKAVQWQVDNCNPDFKEQMKQLVRRAIICKVGYIKVHLWRKENPASDNLSTVEVDNSIEGRRARAQYILDELGEGEITEESPEMGEIKSLMLSLGATQMGADSPEMNERIEFDFPLSTSIIPSENCRQLKDFVAADWVAQEYEVDKELVESVFGVDITVTEERHESLNLQKEVGYLSAGDGPKKGENVFLYEVFNSKTRQRFFVAKGYDAYVMPPEGLDPQIAGFWPLFALTLNDIEGLATTKAGIFPPSDVDLMRNVQKEWNRTRDALRDQRNANAPKYLARDGMISEEDKENIRDAKPNHVVMIKGADPAVDLEKLFVPVPTKPIDPAVYDTGSLEKDMLLAVGMQQANVGPAEADVTATVGTIAEQSRISGVSSNVDDLDGLLTRVGKAVVEIILRGFSVETIKTTVGIGGTLPTQDLNDYLMAVSIKVEAASSGKPNQALEANRMQTLVPLLLQAGANPVAIITEIVRRWDDALDIDKFFPVLPAIAGGVVGAATGVDPQSAPVVRPPQDNPVQNTAGVKAPNTPQ